MLGEGTLVSDGEPETPSHRSGAESEEAAAGDSVEIRSTILDRQSKLDTTGFLLLLTSPAIFTIQNVLAIYYILSKGYFVRTTLRNICFYMLTYHLEFH